MMDCCRYDSYDIIVKSYDIMVKIYDILKL